MRRPSDQNRNELEITSRSAVEHLLRHKPERFRTIFISSKDKNPRLQRIRELAKSCRVPLDASASGGEGPEGVRASLHPFKYSDLAELLENISGRPRAVLLALDHLQDPQNLGAICRTADAFGVSGILIPKDRSVSVTSGVYHASVGAVDTIPMALVANLGEAVRRCKDQGFWVMGTTLEDKGRPLNEAPDFEKIVLLLGSELEGISRHLEKICDWLIRIPLLGKVQSLNVSVAAGILIHELSKPRPSNRARPAQ